MKLARERLLELWLLYNFRVFGSVLLQLLGLCGLQMSMRLVILDLFDVGK